jgi:hypothetical protein
MDLSRFTNRASFFRVCYASWQAQRLWTIGYKIAESEDGRWRIEDGTWPRKWLSVSRGGPASNPEGQWVEHPIAPARILRLG